MRSRDVSLETVSLSERGVLPKITDFTSASREIAPSPASAYLSLNEEGVYVLSQAMFLAKKGALYDGEEVILEWFYNELEQLIVTCSTSKQITICSDLELPECFIKAQGSLFFSGQVKSAGALLITAESLLFAEAVTSNNELKIGAQKGVGFLAPVTAKHLTLDAAHVHQAADISLSGDLDVCTHSFIQEPDCALKANALRLLADECQFKGTHSITARCFIAVRQLILDGRDTKTSIHWSGDNYLHLGNLALKGESALYLAHPDKAGTVIIDNQLSVDKPAIIDLDNTKLSVGCVDNHGEFILSACLFESDVVLQKQRLVATGTRATVLKHFVQEEHSETQLHNSNFFCYELNEYGGILTIDNCLVKGMNWSVSAGQLQVNAASKIYLAGALLLDSDSITLFKDSMLCVREKIDCVGGTYFERATIVTERLNGFENKLCLAECELTVHQRLALYEGLALSASTVHADEIYLNGSLIIHHADISSTRGLVLSSEMADIDELHINADILTLHGSAEPDRVTVKNSLFSIRLLVATHHATLKNSSIYGIEQRAVAHDFRAKLKLIGSRFITDSVLYQTPESALIIDGHSTLFSGPLFSMGAMSAKQSTVFCTTATFTAAAFTADSSALYALEGLFVRSSTMTLQHGASLFADKGHLGIDGSVYLDTTSALTVTDSLITLPSAILDAKKSTVKVKKLLTLGRTRLRESILCAEEARVYDEFTAEDKSKLTMEHFAVAKTGKVRFSDTFTKSKKVGVLGSLHLRDSTLCVAEQCSVWSTGKLTLDEVVNILCTDLDAIGTVETRSRSKKSLARIEVKNILNISDEAQITGDGDLFCAAEDVYQSGTINLKANLIAKGKEWTNFGSLRAHSIYLGYDKNVTNVGYLSAKNMTVHTPCLLNIFGAITATESYNTAGLVSLNLLGAVAANNYSNSSLLSLNGGLMLPNFTADYRYILTLSNLLSATKTVLTTLAPGLACTVGLAFMAPGLVGTTYNLYETYQQFGWQKIKAMRRHEWLPIACQLKNALMLGWNAVDVGSGMSSELSSFSAPHLSADAMDWSHIGICAASLVTGNATDYSALSFNSGLIVNGNALNSNLFHGNMGVEGALLTHNTTTQWIANGGLLAAPELSVRARSIHNAGGLIGFTHCSLKAEYMKNARGAYLRGTCADFELVTLEQRGRFIVTKGRIVADKLTNSGEITLHNLVFEAPHLRNTTSGHIEASACDLSLGEFMQRGYFKLSEGRVIMDSLVNTRDMSLTGVHFEAKKMTNTASGTLLAKETNLALGVLEQAGSITLGDAKAVINSLENSGSIQLVRAYLAAQIIRNAASGVLLAQEAELALGVLEQGGSFSLKEAKAVIASLENSGDMGLVSVYLETQMMKNTAAGRVKAEVADIILESLEQEGECILSETQVVATRAVNKGEMLIDKARLDIKHLTNSETGSITAHAVAARLSDLEQRGALTLSDGELAAETVHNVGTTAINNVHLEAVALVNEEIGHFDALQAEVLVTCLEQKGHFSLHSGRIDVDDFKDSKKANTDFSEALIKGKTYTAQGQMAVTTAELNFDEIALESTARMALTDVNVHSIDVLDCSEMTTQDQVAFFAAHYEHRGTLQQIALAADTEHQSIFYVEANSATLFGTAEVNDAFFKVQHCDYGVLFIEGVGPYSHYQVAKSLVFQTEDSAYFDHAITRNCSITVSAAEISLLADYDSITDLTLISTAGDVSLQSDIKANNLYVEATGAIWTNHAAYAQNTINLLAAGTYYNLGGLLNADTVIVKAQSIQNVSTGSSVAQHTFGIALGQAGIINGRSNTYLEATVGDIANYGGIIRAGEYTQLIAAGNVYNNCNVSTYRGAYDVIEAYEGGLIAGGSGVNTDDIGLYVKACGTVFSDASDFVSDGSIYFEADEGFDFSARQHTYVVDQWTKKKWYGKKENHIRTTTDVKGTLVQSATGYAILRSEHGGLNAVAACFSSPGGTEVDAHGQVQLYSLKAQNREYTSKSSWWGLSKHSIDELHEQSTPTLFVDDGVTRITSEEGSVDARGAYFVGAGDLIIEAFGRIDLGVDILNHTVTEKSRGISISLPGMGAWNAWQNGGTFMDVLSSEDATLAHLNSLAHSGNASEWAANSADFGINLYNTTSSFMRGYTQDTLGKELLSRYGLGDAQGFSPAISLSFTERMRTSTYQTLGRGGIDRGGDVTLHAGDGVYLEHGVRVHAGGTLVIDAPVLIARAAELKSLVKETTRTIGVSVTPLGSLTTAGQLQSVSVGGSTATTEATNYVVAELSADKGMILCYEKGSMEWVELDGAVMRARTLDADIQSLIIRDKQDRTKTYTASVNFSSSGQVSAYAGAGSSLITAEHSGIQIIDGLNTNGHSVHIGEAIMTGGVITTEGENSLVIDKLRAIALADERHYEGIGVSVNVHDFARLAGGGASDAVGEQAIAVAEVTRDHVAYRVVQKPVVYGAAGTTPTIAMQIGTIHTASADGSEVVRHDETHLHLDIPLTNRDFLARSRSNIEEGLARVREDLGLTRKPVPLAELMPDLVVTEARDKSVKLLSKLVLQELLQDAIDNAAPMNKKKIEQIVRKAQKEYERSGTISQQTIDSFNESAGISLLDALKTSSESIWEQVGEAVGHGLNTKLTDELNHVVMNSLSKLSMATYVQAHGLMLTVTFNLMLASIKNEGDRAKIIKEGISYTVADLSFAALLRGTTSSLAGPIGWGILGFGVVDEFTYNAKTVKGMIAEAESTLQVADVLRSKGEGLTAELLRAQAFHMMDAAQRAQALHEMVTFPSTLARWYRQAWDKATAPATARNRFFAPGENKQAQACNPLREKPIDLIKSWL